MLYDDRIHLSEEIHPVKSNNCKVCIVCCYWFFNHGLEFDDSVCNYCYGIEDFVSQC